MWFRIWTIFTARNREYFRDRSALAWNFLFPFLIIIGLSVIFNQDKQVLYKVGIIQSEKPTHIQYGKSYINLKKLKYVDFIEFDSADTAVDRLKHFKIDMLIDPVKKLYWVSRTSPRGYVIERLMNSSTPGGPQEYSRELVAGREIPYVEWLFPGIIAMNIMFSSLFGVGYTVVRYRKNGVLKRFSVTPVRAGEFLTAQVLSRMFLILFTTVIVFTGCMLLYGFECRGSYLTLFLVFSLGSFSLVTLGLLVASRSESEEFANGMLNLLTWPMMFLSEVWFSLEGAPEWVVKLSKIFPLTYMIDGARKIINDGYGIADIKIHLLLLAMMSLVFLIAGSYLFKWNNK